MRPVLYSFRRCPYAMRARMALWVAKTPLELREVVLRDKPQAVIALSQKATVPVLVLPDGRVLEESLHIMEWALEPTNIKLSNSNLSDINFFNCDDAARLLIMENDGPFKYWLDRYKYSDRFPEETAEFYRGKACEYIAKLDTLLEDTVNLRGDINSFADLAIMPFVRQFSMVDKNWFDCSEYGNVKIWLEGWLKSEIFLGVMKKYPKWLENNSESTAIVDPFFIE
ncbi:MAG: glutathione S-transferase [Flavobacteriales bacterium]|jgi:glutathione S-transferase